MKIAKTDVLIIGAGPVGLFAAFELGLFDMRCHLVDSLDRPGGQCTELYADKPIYDIPAQPSIGAQEVVGRLLEQLAPFKPQLTFNRLVTSLERLADGSFRLSTDGEEVFESRLVVIAGGGGAFVSKRLSVQGIEAFEGRSVFASVDDIEQFRGEDVLVVGGGDSIVECVSKLQSVVKSMTVVGRSADLARAHNPPTLLTGRVVAVHGRDRWVTSAVVRGPDGETEVACSRIVTVLGRTMVAGPVVDWGLDLHDGAIMVDTETFQTSEPGVFAIGDICWYPGKLRLILSGFHEAALVAQAARKILRSDPTTMQYTTSSSSLQKKLGVS